jgi:predicted transcriptional regulator
MDKNIEKVSSRAYPSLERVKGKQNWVDHAGGLPDYIERIAKHLHYERRMPIGRAIAVAVSRCKLWAAGGGGVNKDTQAKAAKAIAEWEAKKAKGRKKDD